MVNKIQEIEQSIKNEKIRQLIKSKILNGLICLKKFITMSPGVISPGKIEDKISEIRSYVSIWIKNTELLKNIEITLKEFEERYIEMILPDEDNRVESSEEVILREQPKSLPNYARKLLNEVDPIKGDVSYLPIGPCSHYCIVYKVSGNVSYVIPLTTTEGIFSGYEISKSRFFRGIAIFTLYQFPTSLVKEKLTIPYDHKGELRSIFKAVEDEFRSIMPRKVVKKKALKSL